MSEIDKIQLKDASGQLIAEYDLPGGSGSDTKVTQTYTIPGSDSTLNHDYFLLLSETNDGQRSTKTEGAWKNLGLKFNNYKGSFTVGNRSEYDMEYNPIPIGTRSVSFGNNNIAGDNNSFAQGYNTKAIGDSASAFGKDTTASGNYSHAEGIGTLASGNQSHAEGTRTTASNTSTHAEGNGTVATGQGSHAEGYQTYSRGDYSHSEGTGAQARGHYSHAEGSGTIAGHATSTSSPTTGQYSHAEGHGTKASGTSAHAEGGGTTASGDYSHAEGGGTIASNYYSHAEGGGTTASGASSHAEGNNTTASGNYSHAEGNGNTASNYYAHAEGSGNTASGSSSHAEGTGVIVSNTAAHAEGTGTNASGNSAHAEGYATKASSSYQHVQGRYNIEDANDTYAHIVGNGTGDNARSNAYALRWNGRQDVTNDIVRVDSGGTWDGFNASLEDAFKQNLGECNNYDADTGTYYNFYEIAEIVVDPGTVEDNYEHQDDISNPIVMEISQIVSKNPGISDATGYSVLEIAFKFDLNTVKPEILQFLSSNSLDYFLLEDDNDSTIWHLYGRYRYITQSTPQTKNKSILHRVTGSGFHNNVTVVMENVTDSETIISILGGTTPTRNFVKTSASKDFVRNSAIAANYDNTATYAVGDLCFYQSSVYSNALLICNTAISTPEDFNRDHWGQVTLPGYFAKKSEAIKNITRSGTTFTATRTDDTTFTFTQQDNNTTYTFATGDSNGQIKVTPSGGSAQNVSVKGLAAAAYKGVFTRSSVGDIGWGTEANRTKVVEVSAIAYWNGRHSGTSSNLQYCDRGRFGTIVTKNTGDYLPINPANIEFTSNAWHFLDFHFEGSTDDFTARLIESAKGTMRLYYRVLTNEGYNVTNQYGYYRMEHGGGSCVAQMRSGGTGVIEFLQTSGYGTWATCKAKAFSVQSSKWIKENINDLTDEEALKLLNLRPVTFDYTDGVTKNCRGLIAEEAYEELPYCVDMPEEYLNLDRDPILEADKDEDTDIGILPSIDYSKFVPHLIKLCQIQQKQIDELTERVSQLEVSGFKFEV